MIGNTKGAIALLTVTWLLFSGLALNHGLHSNVAMQASSWRLGERLLAAQMTMKTGSFAAQVRYVLLLFFKLYAGLAQCQHGTLVLAAQMNNALIHAHLAYSFLVSKLEAQKRHCSKSHCL